MPVLWNASFGLYAFLPMGWCFMILIMLLESVCMSKFLENRYYDLPIYKKIFLSNTISGTIGIVISMMLNGGWWLVCWFPWVGSHEVSHTLESYQALFIFYLSAFVLTLITEGFINHHYFSEKYGKRRILILTLDVNAISYLVGSAALYSFSFST